ncbi:MAG: nuclear transport factor 2 family protein [Bacteroidota bacterium]
MKAKELVLNFYKSDAFTNVDTMGSYLHSEAIVDWNSSKGFFQMDKNKILELTQKFSVGYSYSAIKINHILSEENTVSVRYSHFVKAIENPNEEMLLAHFTVFWEVKEDKLFRGFQMSQLS